MRIFRRWLAWNAVALLCIAVNAQQPGRSANSKSAEQLVRQAVRSELAADAADHSLWLYYEVDRKPSGGVVQWAAQTHMGELDRLLRQNGHQLSPAQQRAKMDRFIHDSAAQARQRRGGRQDDKQAQQMLTMLPNAFIWTKIKQEGTEIYLHFRPNPSFNAPTWEPRVFAGMEGEMIVDDRGYRIASLRGRLIREIKFVWGLFGELDPGGTFDVERRETGNGVWQITQTHVHIQGHALIFKSISDQEDDVKSRFEELPQNITLEAAEQLLLQKPE
jgi:hypothetical protein